MLAYNGDLGQSPVGAQGHGQVIKEAAPLKLKSFWRLHVHGSNEFALFSVIFELSKMEFY